MEKHYEDDEIEIDLKELFFELVSNWGLILISSILVGIIAFCISKFIMVPQYASTAQMYVFTKSTSITNLTDLQTSTNLTNDYKVVVTGRPVLEQVIENLELKDETYGSLKGKVVVNNPSNSRILEITVTHPNAELARYIADEITTVSAAFIADKMDQDPPSVIQPAYLATSPVSPNITMNTVLGVAIGAFLAMAIVIISYLLNDTIMTAEDVERKLGLHVLGSLPLEEAEYDGKSRKKQKTIRSLNDIAKQAK